MKKSIYLFIFIGLLSISQTIYSQEVTGSAGEYFEGNDMSISWTLGEVLTETFEGNSLILTQGMQQPPITVTGIEWFAPNQISFEVYPNPTTHFLYVKKPDDNINLMKYKVFTSSGSIIKNGQLDNQTNEIDFTNLPNQLYILKFIQNDKIIGKCKVIKN
jgi:hypothetical protein